MEVKPGYKLTEVGVIPEEWEVWSGEELTTLIGKGGSPRWQGFSYASNGMLFVTSENVRNGFLDVREPKYLPLAFHEKLSRTKLRRGDILINLVGASIGRSCQITTDIGEANVNQAVAVFRVKEQDSTAFIAHYFQAPTTIKRILEMQVDAARPNISLGDLRRFFIPLPPIPEQRAIAEALSDVDGLLDGLDRLIAKKRDLKQAAMRQLLTGQSRLPGFQDKWGTKLGYKQTEAGVIPEEWEVSTVGQEFEIKLGKMLDAEKNVGVPKPYLGNKAVQWNRIDINDLPTVPLTRTDIERFRLRKGDLLVCEGGEVGRAALWYAPIEECYYQKALHRLRPIRGFDSRLMVSLLRLWADRGLLANYVTQTSIAHLPREKLMEVPMPVPPLPEQRAIAELLSDMNAELAALEQRREKTRALKQAMMQELLTGKTRLVAAGGAHA